MRIMMAGPYDPKGRYEGGICNIINDIRNENELLNKYEMDLVPFDTCRIERNGKAAKVNLENIINMLKLFIALPREIKRNRPDILYFHTSRGYAFIKDLVAIKISKLLMGKRTKIILHIHFADLEKIIPPQRLLSRLAFDIMNKHIDEVIFLSSATEQQFREHGLNTKTKVLYNYGNMESPKELVYKGTNEVLNLLFVGSIDGRKGLEDLIYVLQNHSANAILHICGSGRTEAIEHVKEIEKIMKGKVVFHGYVTGNEKQKLFNETDLFVLPSYGEGLPIVIMEALQTGCAVISTSVGAIPEIIKQENGILISPGDRSSLFDALQTYERNRELLEQTKRLNLYESRKYTIESFIEGIYDACEGLL